MDIFFTWLTTQFSAEATSEYATWYGLLEKPFFAPPPALFGIAWGIIYPLIAIALLYTLYLRFVKKAIPTGFLTLFLVNMVFNLTFTPVALGTKDNLLTSVHILFVLGTLLWLMKDAWRLSRPVFILLVPYVLWGTFATVLQLTITALNWGMV